ncbi:hypothetical protein CRG98_037464 [Punica granatum]|uniref:Uncharacterized protein n=1 Tax=Punica granatum TaxID=22663 RepID=A0A2I0IDS2_PUNGR|nr:hypothetical protein CRG98_037464 [Punica granatum]
MAVWAKTKFGFIGGTLAEPADGTPNKFLWVMANSLVVTRIPNSLDKDLQPSIACIENAQDERQRIVARSQEPQGPEVAAFVAKAPTESKPIVQEVSGLTVTIAIELGIQGAPATSSMGA